MSPLGWLAILFWISVIGGYLWWESVTPREEIYGTDEWHLKRMREE